MNNKIYHAIKWSRIEDNYYEVLYQMYVKTFLLYVMKIEIRLIHICDIIESIIKDKENKW